jgi:large subunit ribosomal protein L7/L12
MTEEKKEKLKEDKSSSRIDASEVEVPKKFEDIIKKIEEMSVLDLAELVKILEEKFGVSAAAPVASVAVSAPSSNEAQVEEKSSFNVVLAGIGDKKIEVIKVVRDATQKGLKEAKDLVDAAVSDPQIVRENAKKEEAEELKKKLEAAGAKVELK